MKTTEQFRSLMKESLFMQVKTIALMTYVMHEKKGISKLSYDKNRITSFILKKAMEMVLENVVSVFSALQLNF